MLNSLVDVCIVAMLQSSSLYNIPQLLCYELTCWSDGEMSQLVVRAAVYSTHCGALADGAQSFTPNLLSRQTPGDLTLVYY